MKQITDKRLKTLLKKPLFHASEARDIGVHPGLLSYYIKQGLIEKIGRGVYRNPSVEPNVDFKWEDLFIAIKSVPNGVVCLISALDIYDMTDEIPRAHWIAIPHATTAPKRSNVQFIRTRDIELGRTEIKIGREKIPIFNPERTIVDSFRYLSIEVAIKALKAGLKGRSGNKLDLIKLQTYAQKRKVNITPYVLTATT